MDTINPIHLMNRVMMPNIKLDSDLLDYLVNGDFQPGDRLPTINELKSEDHLNISVSKIREQLEVARSLGLVEVRSKTGMRLRDYSFTPAVRLSLLYALACDVNNFEMFGSLRVHVETAYWNEACATLTQAETDIMRSCIEKAREKLTRNRWIQIPHEEHRTFHLTVFKNLKNPFVLGLLEAYWDVYEAVELNRYADFTYHQNVWDYHERILDCLCAGEYARACELFVEHTQLLRVQPRMQDLSGEDESSSSPP
jgi:DNA-binding FadR family transcriptional regulator